MFDGNFRTGVDRVTKPIGETLHRWRITADVLTCLGMVFAVGCAVAVGSGHLYIGFVLLLVSSLPDLFDGPVAKAAGTASIRGAIFDSVADRITDTIVLCGVAWFVIGEYGAYWAVLPMALLGASQVISYMRAKADIYGFDAKGGLMERAERMIALHIALAVNAFLLPILAVMLALTIVTAFQRFFKIWKQATAENPVLAARLAARREARPPALQGFLAAWAAEDETRRRRWREWGGEQRQARRSTRDEARK